MAIKVYNTLTKQKEEFIPKVPGKASMYVCGVTPYNHPHIGNARPFVTWDVIRRFLEHEGYDVMHVQNFTDVDDKIINAAAEAKISEKELSTKYTNAYLDLFGLLNIKQMFMPKVSDHMGDIERYIQGLISKGAAYVIDGDVYFDVSKAQNYGHVSHQNVNALLEGVRKENKANKKNPLDFVL